jgi:acyl-CoA dehydrogenase
MADFLIWLLDWTGDVVVTIAGIDLPTSTLVLGFTLVVYSLFGTGWLGWKLVLWVLLAGLVVLNSTGFRRERVTLPLLRFYRTVVPTLSDTEREALEAGTVGWDGELFTGLPDWGKLMALPPPTLTAEEQAFLDGPVEDLIEAIRALPSRGTMGSG